MKEWGMCYKVEDFPIARGGFGSTILLAINRAIPCFSLSIESSPSFISYIHPKLPLLLTLPEPTPKKDHPSCTKPTELVPHRASPSPQTPAQTFILTDRY
ncbi:hypothetical protein V6N12_003218 [Hibiscus sabdariffa]|uniref:Uncharacterized protein n=1 Tax=Hibiscus sabdariffa TaxID=183260 RepID=A0ABR2ECQ3_9ROSI